MDEFQEIYLSGGKIEFKRASDGNVSTEYSGSNPYPLSIFQVCISLEGTVLDTVPIGQAIPYPQPSLLALVISDRHGMFGRQCRKCNSYFRTNLCPGDKFCPYCGNRGRSIHYLTDNQLKYIAKFCNSFLDAHNGDKDIVLDLDELGKELPENRPKWLYAEETQQNHYSCEDCSTKYDILGEYGLCPHCGKGNLKRVFSDKISKLEVQFGEENETLSDRHKREVRWEGNLTRCISEFDSIANQIKRYLLLYPATPQRKSSLANLSFQNILKASDYLKNWYGFEILEKVSSEDKKFLNRMFNRRHLFIHNAGRVDNEYLTNTKDTSVRMNQVIKVRSKEIRRLIPLVRKCGERLIDGYESVQ